MSNIEHNNPAPNNDWEDDEIDLLELATTLGQQKKLIFGLPFVVGVVTIIITLFLTPIYTATTTILPPGNSGGGAAGALASLGGLAGLAGIDLGGGTADTVVSMLQSRTMKDQVIDKFDLMKRYDVKYREVMYKQLDSLVNVSVDKKSSLISVAVDDEDPKVAAQMANFYFDALNKMMDRVAVTDAQRRRLFFEQQFAKSKQELADAETRLKQTQQKTGVLELQSQVAATMGAIAQLRADIAQREVALSAMRTYATAENADYKRVAAEIAGLKAELKKMEASANISDKDAQKADNKDIGLVSAGNLPEQGLEYVRALRDVKYQEAIYEIMAKQFELAKVDEAKESQGVQQLDVAVPPDKKSKPKRAIIVVLAVLASGFFAVLLALFRASLAKARQNPQSGEKLRALKAAWRL